LIDTVASVEGPTIHDDYQWMQSIHACPILPILNAS